MSARQTVAIVALHAENAKLRAALTEVRDRLKGHPMYADLSEEQENNLGGDTAEFSYLVRVLNEALE